MNDLMFDFFQGNLYRFFIYLNVILSCSFSAFPGGQSEKSIRSRPSSAQMSRPSAQSSNFGSTNDLQGKVILVVIGI